MGGQEIRFFDKIGFLLTIWVPQNLVKLPISFLSPPQNPLQSELSNTIVGFFGNNTQNKPGLHFFLNTLLRKSRNVNLILVLSIISSSIDFQKNICRQTSEVLETLEVFREVIYLNVYISKNLKAFKNTIENYIQNDIGDDLDSLPALSMFSILRNVSLEKIGTDEEDYEDFVMLIN